MRSSIDLSRKETFWLSCKEKRCCSYYNVALTGRDIWRISRTMQLPPWSYTRYTDAPPDAADGFALDLSEKRFRVILAKRPREGQENSDCIFLLHLPDGHAQCGLGELRPMACKAYPSTLVDGEVRIGDSRGCSCRLWSLAHVDVEQERPLVQELQTDRAQYEVVLRDWLEHLKQIGEEKPVMYPEFCNYLVNRYADLYRTEQA